MLLGGFSDAALVLLCQPKSCVNPVSCLLPEAMGAVRSPLPGILLQWLCLFPFVVSCNLLFSCCCIFFFFSPFRLKGCPGARVVPRPSWRPGKSGVRTSCNSLQWCACFRQMHAKLMKVTTEKPEGGRNLWRSPGPTPTDSNEDVATWTTSRLHGAEEDLLKEEEDNL